MKERREALIAALDGKTLTATNDEREIVKVITPQVVKALVDLGGIEFVESLGRYSSHFNSKATFKITA